IDAEAHSMPLERRVDAVVEPALVTELEGVTSALRKRREERLQTIEIEPPARRQLKQDRAEFIAETLDGAEHPVQALLRIPELLHMGDVAVCLDREAEVVRRLLAPGGEGLTFREAVERAVELDCIEALGVPGKLVRGGEPF